MRQWSRRVPTIYFLDLMMVDAAKRSLTKGTKPPKIAARITRLRRLDRHGNSFSYLLAMLEKVSDPRGKLTSEQLADQVRLDARALMKFPRRASFYETDALIDQCLRDVQGSDIEKTTPRYIDFLLAMNGMTELHEPMAPTLRFAKATEIIDIADSIRVARHHPVVLVTLACLYGNLDARHVLKFGGRKAKPFDPVNVLADIMMIRRCAEKKVEIEDQGRRGLIPFVHAELVTDDHGVVGLIPCFEPTGVTHRDDGDQSECTLQMTVHLAKLLTDLVVARDHANAARRAGNSADPDEYDQICALIYAMPAQIWRR